MADKIFNIIIQFSMWFYYEISLLHAFIFAKNVDFLDGTQLTLDCAGLMYRVFLDYFFKVNIKNNHCSRENRKWLLRSKKKDGHQLFHKKTRAKFLGHVHVHYTECPNIILNFNFSKTAHKKNKRKAGLSCMEFRA